MPCALGCGSSVVRVILAPKLSGGGGAGGRGSCYASKWPVETTGLFFFPDCRPAGGTYVQLTQRIEPALDGPPTKGPISRCALQARQKLAQSTRLGEGRLVSA